MVELVGRKSNGTDHGLRQDKCPAGDNHQGLPKPAMNGGKQGL